MQETITLAKPVSLNGILVNQVTLREPTVGDHLAAAKWPLAMTNSSNC
jgi:hypothetical protein